MKFDPRLETESSGPRATVLGVVRLGTAPFMASFSQEAGIGVARLRDNPDSEARIIAECAD